MSDGNKKKRKKKRKTVYIKFFQSFSFNDCKSDFLFRIVTSSPRGLSFFWVGLPYLPKTISTRMFRDRQWTKGRKKEEKKFWVNQKKRTKEQTKRTHSDHNTSINFIQTHPSQSTQTNSSSSSEQTTWNSKEASSRSPCISSNFLPSLMALISSAVFARRFGCRGQTQPNGERMNRRRRKKRTKLETHSKKSESFHCPFSPANDLEVVWFVGKW